MRDGDREESIKRGLRKRAKSKEKIKIRYKRAEEKVTKGRVEKQ